MHNVVLGFFARSQVIVSFAPVFQVCSYSHCVHGPRAVAALRPPGTANRMPVNPGPCLLSPRTILLSVISLLNEPNTFSPANVDASVMYRKWRDSKGKDREYAEIIR